MVFKENRYLKRVKRASRYTMTTQTVQNGTRIGTDFNAVTFARLQDDFKTLSPDAASILSNFIAASEKSGKSAAFNTTAKPSILSRLRSPEEMIALRKLAEAKEALVSLDPDLGGQIAKQVARKTLGR